MKTWWQTGLKCRDCGKRVPFSGNSSTCSYCGGSREIGSIKCEKRHPWWAFWNWGSFYIIGWRER